MRIQRCKLYDREARFTLPAPKRTSTTYNTYPSSALFIVGVRARVLASVPVCLEHRNAPSRQSAVIHYSGSSTLLHHIVASEDHTKANNHGTWGTFAAAASVAHIITADSTYLALFAAIVCSAEATSLVLRTRCVHFSDTASVVLLRMCTSRNGWHCQRSPPGAWRAAVASCAPVVF